MLIGHILKVVVVKTGDVVIWNKILEIGKIVKISFILPFVGAA